MANADSILIVVAEGRRGQMQTEGEGSFFSNFMQMFFMDEPLFVIGIYVSNSCCVFYR